MSGKQDELVTITDCASNMEASLLRGALESAGIFCYVQGETHRALAGGSALYSSMVALNLMVRRKDAEDALAIVREYRSATAELPEAQPEAASDLPVAYVQSRLKRARLLALFPSFGAGHHHMGAHAFGLILTALAGYGLYSAVSGHPVFGAFLWLASVAADFVLVGMLRDKPSAR